MAKPQRQNGTPSGKFGPGLLLGTAAAMALIATWEGGKLSDGSSIAYADRLARDLPTVCSGLTRHITDTPIVVGARWSAEKCIEEERKAVTIVQHGLERCFVIPPPQSVFDAATSHAWNNGTSATCGSVAMSFWNMGDWQVGCRRIAYSASGRHVWSYVRTGKLLPNGRPEMRFIQGLANRRADEYRVCLKGVSW